MRRDSFGNTARKNAVSDLGVISQGLDISFLSCLSGTGNDGLSVFVLTSHHSPRSLERYPMSLGLLLKLYRLSRANAGVPHSLAYVDS